MLSTGPQYQSGYDHLGNASMMTQRGLDPSQQSPLSGLDLLAQGSQYALQQLHQSDLHTGQQASHRESFSTSNGDSTAQQQEHSHTQGNTSSTSGSVRRRISRACDQCNQLRTKCDGKTPCAHCVGMLFEMNTLSRLFSDHL